MLQEVVSILVWLLDAKSGPVCAVGGTALLRAHCSFDCVRGTAVSVWLQLKTVLGILTAEFSFVSLVVVYLAWIMKFVIVFSLGTLQPSGD